MGECGDDGFDFGAVIISQEGFWVCRGFWWCMSAGILVVVDLFGNLLRRKSGCRGSSLLSKEMYEYTSKDVTFYK